MPDENKRRKVVSLESLRAEIEAMTPEEREVHESVKAAQTQARPPTRDEIVHFLKTPLLLFNADDLVPPGERGPLSSKTVDRAHYERYRDLYNQYVRLPESTSKVGAKARREAETALRKKVGEIAKTLPPDTPERHMTGLVTRELEVDGFNFDTKAVRTALKWLGYIKGKTTLD